ncbi:methionyl-tRNA formyltransferase [Capnocytophaga canimorsus]|nr:methionyl-tRNA formyltransferase [Capnocytophaga canimorsus]CEN44778.1 Methionyl-tRNA formyltransferase [Capnocytophaga canimorsus]
MKENLRIVFMGTPEFALETLKVLVENGKQVVGVVTMPDKPAGRGRKLQSSPVKIYAQSKNIPVLQPENLKDEKFITDLKALQPDLQIVVAFRMLPKVVWQIPPKGTFNLHASLLPNYRGAAPINWAIIKGEEVTGVTTFFIDEKIDTGAIIMQQEIKIASKETAGTLHDKLMVIGADLVLKTVKIIEDDEVLPKPQPKNETFAEAPKIFKETCKIDWQQNGEDIERLIRGMSPYPAAWANLQTNNQEQIAVKIYDADFSAEHHQEKFGTLQVNEKALQVFVPQGILTINELQLPGKKRMKTKELLNGFAFESHFILT